jgi:hypothetical protein
MRHDCQLRFAVSRAQYEALKTHAEDQGTNISSMLRDAIRSIGNGNASRFWRAPIRGRCCVFHCRVTASESRTVQLIADREQVPVAAILRNTVASLVRHLDDSRVGGPRAGGALN